ncbi:MAG: hypothetical protein HOM14_19225 [Gammaproteobacteria bacterium]|jgi:predicted transcriptional regulator of viral defense system|nr:hypothetical protein [Gammaproteobacteria bacterium]MBT7483638.1 hypothetical protein [Candidatus Peregrinibacteria bacterium]MBT4194475.1 hypothetical protein [Gammaproteobacteria bacterium]MBT4449905.1 hypothetical protein [Gammaproteobacteria bacterium]MBT4863464.1 hypothetical protein [Gammaproteobacteria bacterium]
MAHTTKYLPQQELFIEKVLAEFAKKFSTPSFEIPSTRCLAKTDLLKHLVDIRNEIGLPGYKRFPAKDILLHLERSKIITPIKTLNPKTMVEQEKFYLLGFQSNQNFVDPIELLQALEPKGVICYFSALEYYELTTQIPSHHHVAKLIKSPLGEKSKSKEAYVTARKKRMFNPLGKKELVYEGVPYYLTNRDKRLVPGIKERFLNERTKFYITTLEQTLIDTLHKPLSCGGSPVIFEAWQNAVNKLKSKIILEYLNKIGNISLSCRVGYMMEIMEYKLSDELSNFLDLAKNSTVKNNPELAPSLLPGVDFHEINNEWFIKVP